MRVQIIQSVVVQGHPGVRVGDVIEVTPHVGGNLIASGIAREVVQAAAIEVREPLIENRDPEMQLEQPARPRRAKLKMP